MALAPLDFGDTPAPSSSSTIAPLDFGDTPAPSSSSTIAPLDFGDTATPTASPTPVTIADTIGDIGKSIARGVVEFPGAILTGLERVATLSQSIPTVLGNAALGREQPTMRGVGGPLVRAMGEFADHHDFPRWARPSQWGDLIAESYSPAQQAATAEVDASGERARVEAAETGARAIGQIGAEVVGTAKGLYENPRAALPILGENIPQLFGMSKLVASATRPLQQILAEQVEKKLISGEAADKLLGRVVTETSHGVEGLLTAGQQHVDPDDPDFQSKVTAVAAGVTTALIAKGAGKIPGLDNPEAALANRLLGRQAGYTGALPERVIKGAVAEGLIQEPAQSATEQIWQNVADGKPWNEGVGSQAVIGAVGGLGLGAGAGIASRQADETPKTPDAPRVQEQTSTPEEVAAKIIDPDLTSVDEVITQAQVETKVPVDNAELDAFIAEQQERLTETPLTETPLTETPLTETPLTETLLTETPLTETPLTETPLAGTPLAETPPVEPTNFKVGRPELETPTPLPVAEPPAARRRTIGDELSEFIETDRAAQGTQIEQAALGKQTALRQEVVAMEKMRDQEQVDTIFSLMNAAENSPVARDVDGRVLFRGRPVVAVHRSQLPETVDRDSQQLSQERVAVLDEFTKKVFGKTIVLFDAPAVDGLQFTQGNKKTVLLRRTTKGADAFSVLVHELMHSEEGSPLHEALKQTAWDLRTPEAKQLLIGRHGNLSLSRLKNEMAADIGGTEIHKPELWEKVHRHLESQVGSKAAIKETSTFLTQLKGMISTIKELIATRSWPRQQRTFAETLVVDLTKTHDALAAVIANAIVRTREAEAAGGGTTTTTVQKSEQPVVAHPDTVRAFTEIATEHQDAPTRAMLQVQQVVEGGPTSVVVEKASDLTRQLTENVAEGKTNRPQILSTISEIRARLEDYDQDHTAHMTTLGAKYGRTPQQAQEIVDAGLEQYAVSHKRLKAYNRPQWLAREVAVAIGENRREDAASLLDELETLAQSDAFALDALHVTREMGKEKEYRKPVNVSVPNADEAQLETNTYALEEPFGKKKVGELVTLDELGAARAKPVVSTVRSSRDLLARKRMAKVGLEVDAEPTTVRATVPSAKKDAVQSWTIGLDQIRASSGHIKTLVSALRSYPMLTGKGTAENVLAEFHTKAVKNLLWLYDLVPGHIAARAKLWYSGANRIAKEWAKQDDYSFQQHAGVMAVLSPQKDWFMNMGLADRTRVIMKHQTETEWSPEMTAWVERWRDAAVSEANTTSREEVLLDARRLEGTTLGAMDSADAAKFVRIYDETYHSRAYRLVTPEGGFGDYARGQVESAQDLFGEVLGTPLRIAWGAFDTIEKAVAILRDGSHKNIDRQLGGQHKVRNFYNNMAHPESAEGHVTIDTHAVGAAILGVVSGVSKEVAHAFGAAGSNAKTGAQGSYGLLADAYRAAAAKRNIPVHEFQSVTWEAIRSLFPWSMKKELRSKIDAIWKEVRSGARSAQSAREKIYLLSGGIKKFAWEDGGEGLSPANGGTSFDEGGDYGVTATTDPRNLSQRGRVSRSEESLPEPRRPYSGPGQTGRDLTGLPRVVSVDGEDVEFHGFKPAQDAAREYMKAAGLTYTPETVYHKLDKALSTRIADAYEAMAHEPNEPDVKAAYAALVKEVKAQYQAIMKTGLAVEFFPDNVDTYGNPRKAILDVVEHNHFFSFSTRAGFGSDATFDASKNPLLAETDIMISGQRALVNDLFRVVHDYFGHIKDGVGFRAEGEDNAWYSHVQMFSPLAGRAMTTETRGQNSWVNYGPHGEANRKATPDTTIYADQKTGLLPEFAMQKAAPEGVKGPSFSKDDNDRYDSWLQQTAIRMDQEAIGQDVLDTLEEHDISPRSVVSVFWKSTFGQLPEAAQKRFTTYVHRTTGLKVGDVVAVDRAGVETKATTWEEVYPPSDVVDRASDLEGIERGLIALMAVGNARQSRSVGGESPKLTGPSFSKDDTKTATIEVYSPRENARELIPSTVPTGLTKKHMRNVLLEGLSSIPKIYGYRSGSVPSSEFEGLTKYTLSVPENQLADLAVMTGSTPQKKEKQAYDKGFHGFYNSQSDRPNAVMLFRHTNTTPKGPSFSKDDTGLGKKAFLKGSVVRKVVYHGTARDFEQFHIPSNGQNNSLFGDWATKRYAAFFAADPLLANEFANQGTGDSEAAIGQRVIPAYISLKNPLDFIKGITNEQQEALVAAGMNDRFAYELATAKADEAWEYFDEDRDGEATVKIMKAAGFDGAILKESFPGIKNTTSYAIFSPGQVKSSTANSGAFDKTNPDIRFSKDDEPTLGVSKKDLPKSAKVPKVDWHAPQATPGVSVAIKDWVKTGWGKGAPRVYQSYIPLSEMPQMRTLTDANYDWSKFKKGGTYPPLVVVIHENGIAQKLEDGHHRANFWKAQGFTHFPSYVIDFRKERGTVFASKDEVAPTWISGIQTMLDTKMPTNASKVQVRNLLNSPGVKQDEVKWTGIQAYLDTQPEIVNKAALLSWLDQHKVVVNEVIKDRASVDRDEDLPTLREFQTRFGTETMVEEDPDYIAERNAEMRAEWEAEPEDERDDTPPVYEQDPTFAEYTYSHLDYDLEITGSEDTGWNAAVITPDGSFKGDIDGSGQLRPEGVGTIFNRFSDAVEQAYEYFVAEPSRQAESEQEGKVVQYGGYNTPGGTDYTELLLTLPQKEKVDFQSAHWEEPNVVAHVRFDTRGKTLFIQEVQSDWHEEGRKKGYAKEAAKGIANAPFAKTWPELVMKRMLRWAAEKGMNRLAWTTGAQQNDRYGLASAVDMIAWSSTSEPGVTRVEIQFTGRRMLVLNLGSDRRVTTTYRSSFAADINNKLLDDVVGKEITDTIMGKAHGTLSGDGLTVGGTGMKYFYDQMLPAYLNKYLKPFGVKVEAEAIPVGRDDILGDPQTDHVHSIPLTPEMKASFITRGQLMFSRDDESVSASRNAVPTYAIEPPGKLDYLIRRLQDKNIDIKRVVEAIQKAGGKVLEALNPVLAEEMYQKRAEQQSKDFTDDELRPLIDAMRLNKVTLAQMDDYLHARHVVEDNLNMRLMAMNPTLPNNTALSGMTDAEARTILANPGVNPVIMAGLADRVDDIVRTTRKLMVDYGLEKQSRINTWAAQYKAYVPLRREGFDAEGHPTGTGRSVRGSTVRVRGGSNLAVENILANIAQERDQIITRGEKMRPVIAMAGLLMQNPNPALATLDKYAPVTITNPITGLVTTVPGNLTKYKAPTLRRFDPTSGTMKTYPDPMYKGRDNVVNFRIKGEDYAIVFNESNDRAMEVAKAFRELDTIKLTGITAAVAPFTRYLAAINTQYNPIFGIVNFVRDAQFAMLTLSSTPLAGQQATVLKNTISSLKGIYQEARDVRAGIHNTSPVGRMWQRFEHVGGPTGYRDLFTTSTDRAKELERLLNPTIKSKIRNPQDTALFKWLSDYNLTMENSIRLGVFRTAVDQGMSDLAAASLAKNITVNFNKKGQVGAQMGALYAFFNANVQGTARIAETLFERTPNGFRLSAKGKQIVIGGILLGVLQTFALAMAGFDDEDPPEFVKQKNLVIPVGGKNYVMIPMPLGFNLLPTVGRLAAEAVRDGVSGRPKKAFEKGAHLFSALFGTLSPTGGAGGVQELSPTATDPFVALATNTDWTGKKISKEDHSSLDPTPGHARARDTSTVWANGLATAINWATGGSDYTPGVLSPTPDAIDYLVGQVTGGIGREVSKGAQVARSLYTGTELPTHKIPLAGRFVGSGEGSSAVRARFYENIKDANIAWNEVEGRAKNHESFSEYLKLNPAARFAKAGVSIQNDLSALQKQKNRMIAQGASAETIKAQEQRITNLMQRFNQLVDAAEGRSKE